jgi:peptide/nickel transport system ATP-binding protein
MFSTLSQKKINSGFPDGQESGTCGDRSSGVAEGGGRRISTLLSIEQVSVGFQTATGTVRAVDNVTLELQQGQILGLIGETGSGKSVLGLSIPGLLPYHASIAGAIHYKGRNLLDLDSEHMRKLRGTEIAFIPQNPVSSLNPVMRIGRQLVEAIKGRGSRASKREHALRLLQELQLPDPEHKLRQYPFQLSGGMKQRILAAMGAAGSPSLLIADEPTKGLDALVRYQMVELLRRTAKHTGAGMLVITHDLQVAKSLCDVVAVMYAGQVVEMGPARELFHQPQHPYTQGLLRSMPVHGMVPIPGSSPGLSDVLPGCRFYPRCSIGVPSCNSSIPELVTLQSGKVRCWLHDPSGGLVQDVH